LHGMSTPIQHFAQFRSLLYLLRNAIFLIAACAINTWAIGQNDSKNTLESAFSKASEPALTNTAASEAAERARIAQARQQAGRDHEAARVQCYQRFAVTGCLLDIKASYNAQLADLRRQEIALNDVQRKRSGAQQLQRIEDKQSAQKQLELAERRGRALQDDAQRQQRAAAKRSAPDSPAPVTEDAALAQARLEATEAAQVGGKPSSPALSAAGTGRGATGAATRPPGSAQKVSKSAGKPNAAASVDAGAGAGVGVGADTGAGVDAQRLAQTQQRRDKVQARLKAKGKLAASLPVPP
jgi:colicin import membrane protein